MFAAESLHDWHGMDVLDFVGGTIGVFDAVYFDAASMVPIFVAIKLARRPRRQLLLAPSAGVTVAPDYIRVPFHKAQVRHSPRVEPMGTLSLGQERRVFDHYHMSHGSDTSRLTRLVAPTTRTA